MCQARLGTFCRNLLLLLVFITVGNHGNLREVVLAAKFLFSRIVLEYLANVSRTKLYRDLLDSTLLIPLYRFMYNAGPGQDVCQRVKRMPVPPYSKSFFFTLHAGVLPVKIWLIEKCLFVPWGPDCLLCKKPETVQHAFIDCWDWVFPWNIVERTFWRER